MTDKKFKDYRKDEWPKGLYRRIHSYRFRRVIKKKRYFEVWGELTYNQAALRAEDYNHDIRQGIDPIHKKKTNSMSVRALASSWLMSKEEESTQQRYRAVTDNFVEFMKLNGLGRITDVTEESAKSYINYRGGAEVVLNDSLIVAGKDRKEASKTTRRFERGVLHQLFEIAVDNKIIATNPFRKIIIKRPKNDEVKAGHHPLTIDEEVSLIAAAEKVDNSSKSRGNAHLADIVKFMCWTGCREGEVCNLVWDDIYWEDGIILLEKKNITETRTIPIPDVLRRFIAKKCRKGNPESLLFSEKDLDIVGRKLEIRAKSDLLALKFSDVDMNNTTITHATTYGWKPKQTCGEVPMCVNVQDLLARLKSHSTSNYIFAHHDGGRCRLKLLRLLKKAQAIAGIKGRLRLHDLRHTFAVRLRDQGVPLATIMGMMRHGNIKETLIYAPYEIEEGLMHIGCLDTVINSSY